MPSVWSVVGFLSLQIVFEASADQSMRKLHTLKWKFHFMCGGRQLVPVNCLIGTVMEFLQACSSTGLTHSTQVYVVALLAYSTPLGGQSVGRHPLVTRFLQRLRPLARELCYVDQKFYSIVSSPLILPSSWGSRLTSQKLAFGTQAPPTLGLAASKHRTCHRVREAISLAYDVRGLHLSAFGHTLQECGFLSSSL